jgi:two-component system, NtrC family, nitrogen regulation sensor histidine kinase NtrY
MTPAPAIDRTPARRGRRTFLGLTAFLSLLLLATWGLGVWQVRHVESTVADRQAEAVATSIALVERHFDELQSELLGIAREIAESPEVIQSLRERGRGDVSSSLEQLVRHLSGLAVPERVAVEVYDPMPRLVGWNGFSMPLDDSPNTSRFLDTYQTAIARDGETRQALVVWWPVREGTRVLGAARVMRLISVRVPVQNQYLQDYSLSEVWSRMTGLSVRLELDQLTSDVSSTQGTMRLLQGADGVALGRVFIQPPTAERLVETAVRRTHDVIAFWATLLLLWVVAGIWSWYRSELSSGAGLARPKPWGRAVARLGLLAIALVGARWALVALDVPARWQPGKAPLSPLFDPTHLASTIGGGLLRSTGDLLITALFAVALGLAVLDLASGFRTRAAASWRSRSAESPASRRSVLLLFLATSVGVASMIGVVWLLSSLTHHAVMDSTLDYFARTGLIPARSDRLVVAVYCALLLSTLAALLVVAGVGWVVLWVAGRLGASGWSRWHSVPAIAAGVVVPLGVAYGMMGLAPVVPIASAAAFVVGGLILALYGVLQRARPVTLLSLRGILLSVFLLTLLLYPMLYQGMDARRRIQMMDAADSFDEGRDPRIIIAIEQVLREARNEPELGSLIPLAHRNEHVQSQLDSLSSELVRGSILTSFGPYDVSLTFFDARGRPVGRYYEAEQTIGRATLDQIDAMEFEILRQMYEEDGATGLMVEQMTGRLERDRFQYAGIIPLEGRAATAPAGWAMARAEPQSLSHFSETPFPRVLLPAGVFAHLHASLSLADFSNGVLVRSLGRDFGRYRLSEAVRQRLMAQPEVWMKRDVEGGEYLTYYRRQEVSRAPEQSDLIPSTGASIIAVRVPALNTFDHLYYLLRLTLSGLFIGLPVYLIGLSLRRRAGLLPSPRVRFRDKVLNAFLTVGIISVAAVGVVGQELVTEESDASVQRWLRQHLERVEQTLALEALGDELPYRVLSRTHVDSLAARVGLDLNVYQNEMLVASSRPQLVRDRLIDDRLPIHVYRALHFDGYRFTQSDEQLGTFTYKAGYRALLDEQGRPRYVVSVPTLPEQERIEEERARTIAYLFGALLLLVLVVMLTASLLANALARPMGRLRAGLEAVARGQFDRKIPVSTRDEVGELVETFNQMQGQLAESRRILAQQERQLAWREMARQVAHEIKNPLTPMKLSVQHLRRAYEGLSVREDAAGAPRSGRFAEIFERITATLIEQIDALARIANEFHSFARLPTRVIERLDLNAVVGEAVALMQEEGDAQIRVDLDPEPLVVEADREELRRVYINLIKNAIQAIPGGVDRRVDISTRRTSINGSEPSALCLVADNGIGIPEELRDRIFEPNFSTKTSGAGLGLAITRKSIEEMRGEIGFETDEGSGTTFWIRLPLAEQEED